MEHSLSRRQWLGAGASVFATWGGRLLGVRAKPAPSALGAESASGVGGSPRGLDSAMTWTVYWDDTLGRVYCYDDSGALRYMGPLSSNTATEKAGKPSGIREPKP
jgi:hypothetical protein